MADRPANDAPYRVIENVDFGADVTVYPFTNLYGCKIGDNTKIGTFVEIQAGAVIGTHCKIQSHSFICDGVTIGDGVFVGHGVMFVNDNRPRALTEDGREPTREDWVLQRTTIGARVAIGSGATILGGVQIGAGALIGAGAVVTKDVPSSEIVVGNPARKLDRDS